MLRDKLFELYILKKKILILEKKNFGEPPQQKSQYIWKLQVQITQYRYMMDSYKLGVSWLPRRALHCEEKKFWFWTKKIFSEAPPSKQKSQYIWKFKVQITQ